MHPESLVALAREPWMGYLIRTLLCAGFIISGTEKAFRFNAAAAEFRGHHGLGHEKAWLVTYIAVTWIAGALIISGHAVWFGVGMLAVFTAVATVIAFPFWKLKEGPARRGQVFAFREHLNLIAALVAVIWLDLLAGG
jgi:transmembrane protein